MKKMYPLMSVIATLLILAGCASIPSDGSPAPVVDSASDSEQLVGSWQSTLDSSARLTFNEDGTGSGDSDFIWTMENGILTMSSPDGSGSLEEKFPYRFTGTRLILEYDGFDLEWRRR